MWPWSRIRELTQMLQAERALSGRRDVENVFLRRQRDDYALNFLHTARKISDFHEALSKIKGMRTPGANGTVVRMAKVAEDALK